jgi:hypothetical protein
MRRWRKPILLVLDVGARELLRERAHID